MILLLGPPLLAEFKGKPRSYSDTSPRRAIVKAIKGDVRSCTSYMHLPHISEQIKAISSLRGSSSTPHLHQSFSRMHLPHISDPWNPNEDFSTVSVIALAEARDRDNTDDVIVDEEDGDVKEYSVMSDEENDDDAGTCVQEHAIYTWDREMGRTRSLSEPVDLMLGKDDVVERRPRAMSLESVEKAKKPPSRLQFQMMTLSELEEEHGTETEMESAHEESDTEEQRSASILVLAESTDMESENTEPALVDSDSSDEILTRWTRYDSKTVRRPSFSTDLQTIDENLDGISSRLPTDSRSRSSASVLALVEEVTKDVMDRTSTDSTIVDGDHSEVDSEDSSDYIDPAKFWKDKMSSHGCMRRTTLATASPLREVHDYATQIERDAFLKISKWKTHFASKLEDVLGKVSHPDGKDEQARPVVVDVPMRLSNEELGNLKGNMMTELRRKSDTGEVKDSLNHIKPNAAKSSSAKLRSDPKDLEGEVVDEIKRLSVSDLNDDQETGPLKLLQRLYTQSVTEGCENPSICFDNIDMSREKVAELLQWHDKEREHLLQEMKIIHTTEGSPSTSSSKSSTVVVDSASLEKVFLSLQVMMDSIFKETISRLKGTIEGQISSEEKHGKRKTSTEGARDKSTVKNAKKTSFQRHAIPRPSRIPVPTGQITKTTKPRESKSNENKATVDNQLSSTSHVSYLPSHVHTTSIVDHICHQDTCAGFEEETDSSSYTSESIPYCECDSGSEEISTTNSEKLVTTEETITSSGSYDEKEQRHGSTTSTEETDSGPASSSCTYQAKSQEADTTDSKEKERGDFDSSEEENGEEFGDEESDACSEIADLLGVYQVYNLKNDRENERPQAPEPMTYQEKDALDKVKKQKTQLKDCKRKFRELKAKNKRVKEARRQMELQQEDWREEFVQKDHRISELKREVERKSIVMEKFKRALEEKSNIIKQKDRQIMKLLQSGDIDGPRVKSRDTRLQDLAKRLKRALNENVRLQLAQSKKGNNKEESSLSSDNTLVLEFQAKLSIASERAFELERELQESKEKISKLIAENEIINSRKATARDMEDESNESLKAIIHEKDKIMKDIEIRQGKVVQELTEKLCEVMAERDSLTHVNSRLTPLLQLEKSNQTLKEQIAQLQKALEDGEARYTEKAEAAELSVSSLNNKLHQYETQQLTATSSVAGEKENEMTLLKASLDAYQILTQRLIEQRNTGVQDEMQAMQYEKKLGTITHLAHEDHEHLESVLKKAMSAKDAEAARHQVTLIKLQKANQRLQDINTMVAMATTNKTVADMKKKQEALEDENSTLKTHLKAEQDKDRNSSILIEITELQAKLSQRDLQIQELRRELEEAVKRLQKQTRKGKVPAVEFQQLPSERNSKFSNYSLTNKKYDSLAQRYTRQWKEEAELHQQELDELRGVSSELPGPLSNHDEEISNLGKDLKSMKHALDGFMTSHSEHKTDMQDELTKKLEVKVKEMERQDSLYKQMIETREKLYTEVLKEKNHIIKILTETNNKHEDLVVHVDAIETSIKNTIEENMTQRMDELKIQIDNIPKHTKTVQETLPYGVVADALKMNESAVKRLEDCTEETWNKIKQELGDLKEFTFEMADAIEKDLYSSQEQLIDFVKCNSDDVIRCVRDESHVVKKSVLERLQAQQECLTNAMQNQYESRIEDFSNSLDMFGRRNSNDLQQARRDVLLAAEAVTNTADELHHIKASLLDKLPVNEALNKDEVTRRRQMIETQEEVHELRKTASEAQESAKTLQKMEQEYSEKAKNFETSLMMRELQLLDLATPARRTSSERATVSIVDSLGRRARLVSQEGDRLRDDMSNIARLQQSSSSGELQRSNRMADDHRRSYHSLYQTPPSRDYDGLTLRERLQKRARARVIAGNAGTSD
ncbi:hypothetical protein QZH41_011097, partial [Actinostola sp. cb2023]